MSELQHVGEVVEVVAYPVKSMRGCKLPTAHLGWQGLDGDRRYGFVRSGSMNGLPWVSARQLPEMIAYAASFDDPGDVRSSGVTVTAPSGDRHSVRGPELAAEIAEALGAGVHLMRLHRGAFDAMPVSIITTGSIRTISAEMGMSLEPARFRANVLIEAVGGRAYPEEKWVGRCLAFGASEDPARVRVNRKDDRCSVVNLDPATGGANAPVHRTIVERRRNFLGVYGSPERPGRIAVGDPVYLRPRG